MTDYRSARYKDGSAYAGHKQYLGNGLQRSCAKCGQHQTPGGFKLVKPWGLVGPCCQSKEKP